MTNTEWLRERLLRGVNTTAVGDKTESLAELRKTEWCEEFEMLMRNRLLVGRFRYGKMADPEKGNFEIPENIILRVRAYQRTGNLEHLVDVANLALVEFRHSKHPKKHFSSADDGQEGKALRKERE